MSEQDSDVAEWKRRVSTGRERPVDQTSKVTGKELQFLGPGRQVMVNTVKPMRVPAEAEYGGPKKNRMAMKLKHGDRWWT